jgi:arylsulfatase A-like enzyme
MRRPPWVMLAAAIAALGCPGRPPAPSPTTPAVAAGNRLNVLLVTIDTLRADHLGCYGYGRPTSPRLDAFAREAVLFTQAYTYWPKTRGSFVAMMTGRRDSQTGYNKEHPVLRDFNPTLASVLQAAGYRTLAVVDNGNVASDHGYAKGFESYRQTWQEKALATEMDRARAITAAGVEVLGRPGDRPFFLWLHYVNPHAPYSPPPPYDAAFLGPEARTGPALPVVNDYRGGIARKLAVPGQDRLGYYVAQYDGEIATVDQEVGRVLDALRASPARERTLVVVTSDHGESLGEHGYYFDHGEDLFDPTLRVPLLVAGPGLARGVKVDGLASTLDLVPTVLDVLKVSYPPDLAGASLLPALEGGPAPARPRLPARSDRNLTALFGLRFKVVSAPADDGPRFALYDRRADPGEEREASRRLPEDMRTERRELELFLDRFDKEWTHTRRLAGEAPPPAKLSPEACENLRALGYTGVPGCGF